MKTINHWTDLFSHSMNTLGTKFGAIVLDLFLALLVLLVGWFLTKLLTSWLQKLLNFSKIDSLFSSLNWSKYFERFHFDIKVSEIITTLFKWFLLFLFFIAAIDILKWDVLSIEMGNLLNYLPKLFSGIALFFIGMYFAYYFRKTLNNLFLTLDLAGGRLLSSFVYYVFAIMITITSLNQAEIKTEIITNNLTIFLSAFLLTFAIAFGLGSKEIIQKLLYTFYTKKNFEIGNRVRLNNIEGVITSIDNITIIIQTKTERIVFPIEKFMNSSVTIFNEPEV